MIKNLVFSGGGFKCWAYIGTLRALSEFNIKSLEQIIGVSAGSFFGLLYMLNIKWEFVLDFFMEVNFKELYDIEIDNILIQHSLFAGLKFTEIIKEVISYKIDPEITFSGLRKYSGTKFTVSALNVSSSKLDYFNYLLTPDIKVVDAIRASCNLPMIFPPYKIGDSIYYDGGIVNNCPADVLDELSTVAFDLMTFDASAYNSNNVLNLLGTMIKIMNESKLEKRENVYTILDKSFSKESFNLNQTRDDIFNLYMNGYKNSHGILLKNYFSLPEPKNE
jgi:predicted acylesterase/phospholipase RssA